MMGPVVSARQRDRVLGYIEKGQQEGAKLVFGGGKPAHLPKGFFVEPTLFVDVDNSMTIAQEEIFGPVLAVIPYEDDDDAVRIANESAYGLSGGVFSASEERATSIARRIRTGSIGVNGGLWYGADSPYGGYKAAASGASAASRASSSTSRPRPSPGPAADAAVAGGEPPTQPAEDDDHSPTNSSTVARRATKARLCLSIDAWCDAGVPTEASVATITP